MVIMDKHHNFLSMIDMTTYQTHHTSIYSSANSLVGPLVTYQGNIWQYYSTYGKVLVIWVNVP
jgi:hypothetical protein